MLDRKLFKQEQRKAIASYITIFKSCLLQNLPVNVSSWPHLLCITALRLVCQPLSLFLQGDEILFV